MTGNPWLDSLMVVAVAVGIVLLVLGYFWLLTIAVERFGWLGGILVITPLLGFWWMALAGEMGAFA